MINTQCCRAYRDFVQEHPGYPIDVTVCAYTDDSMEETQKVFCQYFPDGTYSEQ